MLEATRRLAQQVAGGQLAPEAIDEAAVAAQLHTAGMPPVDLLIRTAGEQRISNFLLWQTAGAEFHVTHACWPDFRREHLIEALTACAGRREKMLAETESQA